MKTKLNNNFILYKKIHKVGEMVNLKIYTVKDDYVFEGIEAERVMNEITKAASGNAEWTVPVNLNSGKSIMFVLSNIIVIEYE